MVIKHRSIARAHKHHQLCGWVGTVQTFSHARGQNHIANEGGLYDQDALQTGYAMLV